MRKPDPFFPDRPQHEDFWRLSQTALWLDGRAKEDLEDVTADFVDVESVEYMAEQRADLLLQALGFNHSPRSLKVLVTSCILGGIVHGIAFEKAGGHSINDLNTQDQEDR